MNYPLPSLGVYAFSYTVCEKIKKEKKKVLANNAVSGPPLKMFCD